MIEAALAERRKVLSEMESKALLARLPHSDRPDRGRRARRPRPCCSPSEIGFPVAMKIDSPDITHKTDVGGVRLNIANAAGRAQRLSARSSTTVQKRRPRPSINGVADRADVLHAERPRADGRRDPRPDLRPGHHLRRRRHRRRGLQRPRGRAAAAQQLPGRGHDRVDRARAQLLGEFRNMPPVDLRRAGGSAAARLGDGLRTALDAARWTSIR